MDKAQTYNVKETSNREHIIMRTSVIGIVVNLLLAGLKIIIGIVTSSIAITSEGVNNATDSLSSFLTIIGTKLSAHRPTRKHPFGFGRIEYLTSLVIVFMIIITGFEFLKSSIKLIKNPVDMNLPVIILIIIAFSAFIKLILGLYTISAGKKVCSDTLIAVGMEGRNDCLTSVVTILSSVIYLCFHISLDAWAGIIISIFILKAGFDLIKDTISVILGESTNKELADKLYLEIRNTDCILNVADMILHNYGPESYSGSVNIEVDHKKTIGEVYEIIHTLQLRIMHEYGVTMVFGMYAVDNDEPDMSKTRTIIAQFVKDHEHVISFHALFIRPEEKLLYCDLVVDYEEKNWETLKLDFEKYLRSMFPDYTMEIVIETEYV